MDHSHNGSLGGIQFESAPKPTLHKKRSLVKIRSDSISKQPRPITTSTIDTNGATFHEVRLNADYRPVTASQRKGSLRNVVRKIFGRSRSSRVFPPEPHQATPPRHKYHKSEPPGMLPAPRELPDTDREREDQAPHRALSAPLHIEIPQIHNTKVRSPYAVEFPKSARLKPLDISSPFAAPGPSLRRRKTLPSILIAGDDAVAIAAAAKKSETPPMPARASAELVRPGPASEIGVAISGVKDKRRSRSVSGIPTRDSGVASEPERKRSEEIRFWRESYQGSVLRASGFMVPFSVPPPEEQERDDKWQTARDDEQRPLSPTARSVESLRGMQPTSHSRQDTLRTLDGSTPLHFGSNSRLEARTSRDLEDRVAQLEANVQFFQRSLQKLQADRNRRTVIVGDNPSTADQRKSYRTPSMLADDLHVPTNYARDDLQPEVEAPRPATAPHPRSPIAECPPVPPLPNQSDNYSPEASPTFLRPSTPPRKPSNLITTNPNVAFKSLYQMLADERSARRRLEHQMRALHTEIQDLQQQVSTTSYSHRSSYMLSHEATVASTRLRELLRETESRGGSPEDTPRKTMFISRFSGSTTGGVREIDEAGNDDAEEEAQTPCEEYKTPQEEQSPFRLERDGEMF